MTHSSVVGREYGIPAVVGVHEATWCLNTRQRVRVDGSAGRMIVLDGEVRGRTRVPIRVVVETTFFIKQSSA